MSVFTLKASKSNGGTEKAPPGNHLAVLVAIVDMGTQLHSYKDLESWKRDVYLVWELVGEQVAGANRNHVIAAAVTFSLNEKATLRKWVEARTGKAIPDGSEFDISAELGQPCLLNVVVNQNGYPRVEGMASVPKNLPVPAPSYQPVIISLEEFRGGAKSIPEWVPWHFGNPLIDHINACKEIGQAKPTRRPAASDPTNPATIGENGAPVTGTGPALDPNARWDYSDGSKVVQGATTAEVQAFLDARPHGSPDVRVKPHGAPRETAKPTAEVGFKTDPIPW